ncbi:MAG: substrate-binding domain-containing protein, partial [Porcipelethomonas sp.]
MKKICVIMIGFHSEYARMTTEGMTDQAAVLGYQICVHSYFGLRIPTEKTFAGETNILNLIDPEEFDAFIIHTGIIPDEDVRRKITEIAYSSGKPVIDFDEFSSTGSDNGMWSDRQNFRKLTEHLLDVHGFTNIWCITGPQGNHQSENRLLGYRDALISHGIEPRTEWEFYGDFWRDHAKDIADRIADGMLPRPQAIACAGTIPAVSLIERLSEHGIRVPEDIAVMGYDCFLEGEICSPAVTYVSSPDYNQGVQIMCRLHNMLTGESISPVSLIEGCVYPAGSCGCHEHGGALMRKMKKELSEQLSYQDMFRNSGMQETLSTAENLQDFLMRLTRVEYLIRGLHTIHYFICDDWDGVNNQTSGDYRCEGYSDRLIVHTHSPLNGCSHCQMHRSKLIEYITETDEPTTCFLFPIHYEDRAFGFLCLRFTESRYAPDALCWSWIELLNNALETLRIRSYLTRFSQRRHIAAIRDNLTGFYNRRGFEEISADMYEYAVIHREKLLLCAVKLYNLSEASEVLGFEQTDEAIIAVSEVISRYLQGNEQCCRVQDGCFWIAGTHPADKYSSHAEHKAFEEDCRKQLASIDENNLIKIDIAAFFEQTGDRSLESILNTLEIKL